MLKPFRFFLIAAVALTGRVDAETLTGCLGPAGVLTGLKTGSAPLFPCGPQQTQVTVGGQSAPRIVDSSGKVLGSIVYVDIHSAQVLFAFEGRKYHVQG